MFYNLFLIKKAYSHSIIAIIVLTFFSTCKTDIEINAPYKETSVVYGLLNAADSIHFIKINKTFLGEESAYTMATNQDSSDYNTPYTPRMTATVEEWKTGTIQRTWILKDTLIKNKEAGTFYAPEQTLYYFIAASSQAQTKLDASAQYRLTVNINEGEKLVAAKTSVIDNFLANGSIGTPCPGGAGKTCLAFYSNDDYRDSEFKWPSVKNGKRYQLKMTIKYKEYLTDNTSSEKSIDWLFQPPVQSNTANGGQQLSIPVKGEDFYKEIQRQLEPLTNETIKKREFVELYFTLSVAADEFNTYLLANEPSTGIIQEKPEYTNIDNGIGIFSSRIAVKSDTKLITDDARKHLATGLYTQSLKFCENIGGFTYGTCPP